jgi:tetratricopeptide (TPR) repeat protein
VREPFFNEQIRQYFEEDKLAEAAVYCAALLSQIRDTLGERHPDVAHVLSNVARAYYYLGGYPAALEATKELVKIDCAPTDTVSVECICSLSNLALNYRLTERIDEAELAYDRALELIELLPLGEEWDRAITLVGRAQVHDIKREFDQAERLLQEAVRIRARSQGWYSPGLALVFDNLAGLHRRMGKSLAAERAIQKAIRMYRHTATTESVYYAGAIRLLARLLVEQSKVSEAKELADESLAILRRVCAAGHPETKKSESLVGKLASQ